MENFNRFAGLALTAIKSNFGQLDKPYKLNFAVTYWCQSRCLTCNIWQIKPKGELRIDEIAEFAKKNTSFRWLELTGGEPFLRSDIVNIAEEFYNNCKGLYMLTMPTNSLCDRAMVEKKLRKILDLGIPKVIMTVSLDGHRDLEDKIRGVKGNYEKAMSMFDMIHSLKGEYRNIDHFFGYTISKFNQGELKRTIDSVAADLSYVTPNDFHVNMGQVSSNYYGNEEMGITANNVDIVNDIETLLRMRKRNNSGIGAVEASFLKKLLYYAKTGNPPLRSRSLDASLFLDSFGNVYPSIMWDRKVCNIRDTGYDLSKVWRSDEVDALRKEIADGKEPKHWTACEAYQSIVGNITSMI
jgi:MoaA/NifB/PqqE/SkfB family radical SAM enzyme